MLSHSQLYTTARATGRFPSFGKRVGSREVLRQQLQPQLNERCDHNRKGSFGHMQEQKVVTWCSVGQHRFSTSFQTSRYREPKEPHTIRVDCSALGTLWGLVGVTGVVLPVCFSAPASRVILVSSLLPNVRGHTPPLI
ncbi:MAG: hypothetical protein MHM6MM_009008 [Cercozoa sp. M6MM]